jgi:hypothetical protein
MSEQHEDHVGPEVVPVEVDQEHEVVESPDEPVDAPNEGDETAEPEAESHSDEPQPQSWQEERYERACADPEYAAQQAIDVPEEDRGPAWDYDEGLAGLAQAEALEADADDDSSEEV